MGQALYRKYRSKSLGEVVGQEHITTTLKNALKNHQLAHALLLAGPRGVGKTSVARIIAHAVNDLSYSSDTYHVDIIEIDAASNRRIDEIRDLREKVHIAPAQAKYKIYIIDEVHMLTKEAFNALLKTLEEPPAHAIFILATTEPHKLPETIISRTQRFNFKPIAKAKMAQRLAQIAKSEKIGADPEALSLIADYSDGSFRDALSWLDQLRHSQKRLVATDVRQALGVAKDESLDKIAEALSKRSIKDLMAILEDLKGQGIAAMALAKQLSSYFRHQLIDGSSVLTKTQALKLLRQLLDVASSPHPYTLLEISLIEAMTDDGQERKPDSPKTKKLDSAAPPPPPSQPSFKDTNEVNKAGEADFSLTVWEDCLSIIKQQRNTLYSIARMARPKFKDGRLVLYFAFDFHKRRIDDLKNKQFIADSLKSLTNKIFEIECLADKQLPTKALKGASSTKPAPALDSISNIFGSVEVLES